VGDVFSGRTRELFLKPVRLFLSLSLFLLFLCCIWRVGYWREDTRKFCLVYISGFWEARGIHGHIHLALRYVFSFVSVALFTFPLLSYIWRDSGYWREDTRKFNRAVGYRDFGRREGIHVHIHLTV
jgi:hypothetical protein